MELDDGEALRFWQAALLEADKVVKEHEKAISVAERRGLVLWFPDIKCRKRSEWCHCGFSTIVSRTKGAAMEELQQEYMFWQSARVEAEAQIMQLQAGTYRKMLVFLFGCFVLDLNTSPSRCDVH
jgi:hypothetical protein